MKKGEGIFRSISAMVLILLLVFFLLPGKCPSAQAAAKKPAVKKVDVRISGTSSAGRTYYLMKGKKLKLQAVVIPAKAKKKTTFQSSKMKVATVTSKGVVKAKKTGTTKITVKVKGKSGKTKKTWVKIKVINSAAQIPATSWQKTSPAAGTPGDSSGSAGANTNSCPEGSHQWELIKNDVTISTDVVKPASYYGVCMVCGYVDINGEGVQKHNPVPQSFEVIQVGVQLERMKEISLKTYRCKICKSSRQETDTSYGPVYKKRYENPYLNPGNCGYLVCEQCHSITSRYVAAHNGAACTKSKAENLMAGTPLHIFENWEEKVIYPWDEEFHYYDFDEDGVFHIIPGY